MHIKASTYPIASYRRGCLKAVFGTSIEALDSFYLHQTSQRYHGFFFVKMTTILSLPDELLAPILHDSVLHDCAHRVAPLALVCQCFHRIITPLLYRDIDIQCNGASGAHQDIRRTKLLHHTFRSKQSLRQHCQSLVIKFGPTSWDSMEPLDGEDTTPNLAYIAVDFVKWLYNTAELRISLMSFYDDTWYETFRTSMPSDLFVLYSQAPKSLTRLKLLQIDQENAPMHLPTLIGSLECLDNSACLRILDLTGVSQIGTEHDWKRLKVRSNHTSFLPNGESTMSVSERTLIFFLV